MSKILVSFNSIQSLQYRKPTNSIDGLINAVEEAYARLERKTLDKCFVTLQKVMECILLHEGGNAHRWERRE